MSLPDALPFDLLVIAAGAFAGALVSGLSGFAFGVSSLSVWGHFLAPALAAPLIVVCSLIVQLSTLLFIRRAIDWRGTLPYVVGGAIGVPLGVLLLAGFPPGQFRVAVGWLLCLYCAAVVLTGRAPAVVSPGRAVDGVVGFGGGVLGGFAGLSGVLPTLWCTLQKWPKDRQRTTYQVFNTAMHTLTLTFYGFAGRLDGSLVRPLLAALPALALGTAVGFLCYRRVNDVQFRRIVLCLLALSGVTLLLPR